MSRLDSFIRRMQAQRACLDWAARAIAGLPGDVMELGLGNGRTYDHLREKLPDRAIWVFDRRVAAHPACIPPRDRMVLGEVLETMPGFVAAHRDGMALIHADLGSGDDAANRALAAALGPLLVPVLVPGGVVVANIAFAGLGWQELPEPPGVSPGRYYLYRRPLPG
ncbi:class I SAM-dependent methyltransferase [Inquilinus limosus]|uniref:class I SAM-dependent methyltransferase n=1 Tax=Inquilinus limosus TaxID=171674 RepID=UPI0003FB3E0F|nr:class I SAM-dependent methyltransferase [Inquilinus limosus]